MKKRILFGIGTIVLVLAIIYLISSFNSDMEEANIQTSTQLITLDDFLSHGTDTGFMPKRCQMPTWSSDLNDWKKHLEHHSDTKRCSVYYLGVDEHGN